MDEFEMFMVAYGCLLVEFLDSNWTLCFIDYTVSLVQICEPCGHPQLDF